MEGQNMRMREEAVGGRVSKPYYSDEAVTIYHGDCRDIMPTLPKVDLVLTDPPYGNGTEYASYDDSQANLAGLIRDVYPLMRLAADVVLLTPGVGNMWKWPEPTWTLCWTSPAGAGSGPWGFCCWQPVLAYGKDPYLANGLGRRPDYYEWGRAAEIQDGHPCSKPLPIMRWLVERGMGQTILDPFMGSGTTLRAAKDLGRKAIGIEIEERYCEIAAKRMSQLAMAL